MQLTQENYHSQQANIEYMSNSQYGGWMKCPAHEHAKIFDGYGDEPKEAFEIGSYTDCQLLTPEDYPAWYRRHLDALLKTGCISKKDGKTKTAKLVKADAMIATAQNDPGFMEYLKGDKQVILTFPFGGCMWRVMLDVLNKAIKRMVDLKSTKSIVDEQWLDGRTIFDRMAEEDFHEWHKGPFYEVWNYWRQLGIYGYGVQYTEGWFPDCFLAPISKESPPDKAIIHFGTTSRLNEEVAIIGNFLPQILKWKTGKETPPRCGVCEFCRETKTIELTGVVEAVSMS